MKYRNPIRLLAVLLTMVLLAVPVSAGSGQRLSVEREVYAYLTEELKLTTAAACGVLANIEHESSFQPTIYGDQGTSYGLCQWHNERFSALRGYCAALGLGYQTVEGQLSYLKYELGNNYTNLLLTLQSIDNTPEGAYKAAYLWCIQFEKPSNMQQKAVSRGELARGKYWARYSHHQSIIIAPEPEPTEPDPEIIIEQLRQEPVSIPLPPEAEDAPLETGAIRHFRFQKPAFIYYTPYHLPNPQPEPSLTWHIPALACIGAAMVLVVIFPTKKRRPSLYRRGKYMVK